MPNGRTIIIYLTVALIKMTLYKMSQYFPKPCKSFGGDFKVELDLSSYAREADLKKKFKSRSR